MPNVTTWRSIGKAFSLLINNEGKSPNGRFVMSFYFDFCVRIRLEVSLNYFSSPRETGR